MTADYDESDIEAAAIALYETKGGVWYGRSGDGKQYLLDARTVLAAVAPSIAAKARAAEEPERRASVLAALRPIASLHSKIEGDFAHICHECEVEWPCATRKALRQAMRDARPPSARIARDTTTDRSGT